MPSPSAPKLSVVTPTHRRPDLLDRLLRSLSEQTVDAETFEVVVVDDASGDRTRDVLQRWSAARPSFRSSSLPVGRGPASARNLGVRLAQGELILFLDDDVEAVGDLLETHLRFHDAAADPSLGVLGRVDWHDALEITPFMRWLDGSGLQFAYDTWMRPGPIDPPYGAFYTANLSMSRALFVRSGGFDERFPYPAYEDMELAWRLASQGFRLEYRPEAKVFHTRAIDLPTFRRRMAKVAESAVLLGAVQPGFPVTPDDTPERWRVPTVWERLRRSIALKLRDDDARRDRFFRGEIARAYREGLERGRAQLDARIRSSSERVDG